MATTARYAGYLDEDGYLFLTGRIRESIIRGGENISPAEIHGVLVRHPAVAMAAGFGVASATMGEEVMAAIVLKPGKSVDQRELGAFVARSVAFSKVPKQIFIVDELPLNGTGKIMRRELSARFQLNA